FISKYDEGWYRFKGDDSASGTRRWNIASRKGSERNGRALRDTAGRRLARFPGELGSHYLVPRSILIVQVFDRMTKRERMPQVRMTCGTLTTRSLPSGDP